jgi:membrane-associated protease RseP (regulator of RpoE activity)
MKAYELIRLSGIVAILMGGWVGQPALAQILPAPDEKVHDKVLVDDLKKADEARDFQWPKELQGLFIYKKTPVPSNNPHAAVIERLREVGRESCRECHATNSSLKAIDLAGLGLEEADDTLRTQLKLGKAGLVVVGVEKGSSADQAKIVVNDIILGTSQTEFKTVADFRNILNQDPDKPVEVKYLHGGVPSLTKIPPRVEWKHSYGFTVPLNQKSAASKPFWIGVQLSAVSDAVRTHLRLSDGEGCVIDDVIKDSPAHKAGLLKSDVVTKVDNKPLKGYESLVDIVQEVKDGRTLALTVRRAGDEKVINIKPEKRKIELTLSQPKTLTPLDALRASAGGLPETHYLADPTKPLNIHLRTPEGFQVLRQEVPLGLTLTPSTDQGRFESLDAELKALNKQLGELKETLKRMEKDAKEKK